jgi:hypothetical protein
MKRDRKREREREGHKDRERQTDYYLATSPAAGSRRRYCGRVADYKSVLRQLIDG